MKMARAAKRSAVPEVATRDQLLIAAGELMIESGNVDISLSDIALKTGLNSALVKYYFGNKAGLLMALIRKVVGGSLARLDEVIATRASPEEKLKMHITGIVNTYYRFPYINRLLHFVITERGGSQGATMAAEIVKPLALSQKQILDEGVASGRFRKVDPMLFYFHIIGACDQLFYGRYILQHGFGIDDISATLKHDYVNHLYEIIVNGLLAPPNHRTAKSTRANRG
jgi:TetR/AcrR family transcriptional regulator